MNKLACLRILKLGSDATLDDVKQAHRDLVNVWHPDRFSGNPRLQQKAELQLKEINTARDTLIAWFKSGAKPRNFRAETRAKAEAAKKRARKKSSERSSSRPGKTGQSTAGRSGPSGSTTTPGQESKTQFKARRKKARRQIEEKINDLPLIDVTIWEVISLLDNPNSNFQQVAEKVSPDIATRVLHMASSAFYGRRQVKSINYAVQILGYKELKKLLITSILIDHFAGRLKAFSFKKFQIQAQLCAAVARMMGEILPHDHPEDLFTAGMLHNIGKLVIAVYFKEEHRQIIDLKQSQGIHTTEAEERVLGMSHAEIGALTLERFNIPDAIVEAVRDHNLAERSTAVQSHFKLKMITREAAELVARCVLPDNLDELEKIGPMQNIVAQGRAMVEREKAAGIYDQGNRHALVKILELLSRLIEQNLKPYLQVRPKTSSHSA